MCSKERTGPEEKLKVKEGDASSPFTSSVCEIPFHRDSLPFWFYFTGGCLNIWPEITLL